MVAKEIIDAEITFVSLVGKGANGKDFLIVKSNDATPSLVRNSPIIKVDEEKRLVTGVVYEPDVIDSQGEFMTAPAIEKAAHSFLKNYRNIDKGHTFQAEDAQVVESYIAKSDHTIGDTAIKTGTWVMTTYIGDDTIWEQVKKGELNAYSMGGSGKRIERPDIEAPVEKAEETEMKGFFSVLKSTLKEFFTGESAETTLKKEEGGKPPTDFTSIVNANRADEALSNARWALSDVIRNILTDNTITDKAGAVSLQIDAYKNYVISQIQTNGIEKAVEQLSEPVVKAGKKISTERLKQLKEAYETIGMIISGAEPPEEGEETMTKEQMSELLKEQLSPLTERLDKLEKAEQEQSKDVPSNDAGNIEVLKSAVAEAVKPLEERLTSLENSRGIRKSDDEEIVGTVTKENSVFDGLFM